MNAWDWWPQAIQVQYFIFTCFFFGINNVNHASVKIIGASDEQVDVFNEVWYIMLLNNGDAIKGKISNFLSNFSNPSLVIFNYVVFYPSNWSNWEANQEERRHCFLMAFAGKSCIIIESFHYGFKNLYFAVWL